MKVTNNTDFAAVEKKVRAAIGVYADTAGKKMEASAKSNAPWIDRTSHARGSILGSFGWQGDKAIITLSGNMDYSVYLELAMGKRYAILKPTIEKHANSILAGYRRLI